MNAEYTDIELRMKALPIAVQLVDNEVQRVRGYCNTKAIAEITTELLNILKYGEVTAPDAKEVTILDATPVVANTVKFG